VDVPVEEAAADPTTSAPPAGKVWVKIPLPDDSARTFSGTNNSTWIDYYEVFFVTRDGAKPVFETMGTATPGNILAVLLYPSKVYDALLLAGNYNTRTLLASAYKANVAIVPNTVNNVNFTLAYVESDPTSDFEFTGYYEGDTTSYKLATGSLYQFPPVKDITISNGGNGYTKGDRLVVSHGSLGDLPGVVKVEEAPAGAITKISIENPGRFAAGTAVTNVTSVTITGSNSSATFSFTPVSGSLWNASIPDGTRWMSFITRSSSSDLLTVQLSTKKIKALIDAGDDTGKSNFSLVKAELWLKPLVEGFDPVYKLFPATGPDYDVTGDSNQSASGDTLTLKYGLDVSNIPSGTDAYGFLYNLIQYRAFNLDKGSTWSIRSGLNVNAFDTGATSSGARVLAKIGNPQESPSEAQINY
jgi:hypothetical protein